MARTVLPGATGSVAASAMRAQAFVEAVFRRSSATSLSNVAGFHDGWMWIAVTLRMSPGDSSLSCQAPITSFRLAGVVPPSTQCAAVSTQIDETSVAPQNAKPPVVLTDTKNGYAPAGAMVPPTMLGGAVVASAAESFFLVVDAVPEAACLDLASRACRTTPSRSDFARLASEPLGAAAAVPTPR